MNRDLPEEAGVREEHGDGRNQEHGSAVETGGTSNGPPGADTSPPTAVSDEDDLSPEDFVPAEITAEEGRLDSEALAAMEADEAVQAVIRRAAALGASDLFLHTHRASMEIAVRRLGTVYPLAQVPPQQGRHLISYIKAMAEMDISEHRRPMDGRWLFEDGNGSPLELRVNTLATLFGEDMTLRLWDRQKGVLELGQLGMFPQDVIKLTTMLQSPSGLILVTGPTGTGKTTTLYTCLQHLNDGQRKISTLEDPVEYALDGVRQSQVHPKIGLDFPELLRNVLRQAPNVIMIGEVRDEQTAITAVRAANSGHVVLATLHAPIAAEAVQTLLALGAPPYFLSSCLLGIVAQRLVRTLCPYCRLFCDMSEAPQALQEIQALLEPGEGPGPGIYAPCGCPQCLDVGYTGRTGLFEVMTMNQEIRQMLAQMRPSTEIERAAIQAGMIEFRRGSMLKVAQGVTSIEEVLREVPAEYLGLDG